MTRPLTIKAAMILAALILAGPAGAHAADLQLFAPSPPAAGVATATGSVRLAQGAAVALTGPAGTTVVIEVAPGTIVRAERQSGEFGPDGLYLWSGDIDGDPSGAVDLAVRHGRVTGQVTLRGKTYAIRPAGIADVHSIAPLDLGSMPEDRVLVPPSFSPMRHVAPDADSPAAVTLSTARVLFAFTPDAEATVSDIASEAALAISLANGAFRRSGAHLRLKLAGVKKVTYDDVAKGFNQTLTDATSGTGPFAAVRGARDSLKADFVSVLTASVQYCGLAWLGPSENYAYSVVSTVCIPYHTFAHELGHNIGLRHDRYVEAKAPKSVFNFGFVNKKGRIRDIMSYANACNDAGFSCDRVPMFSTPLKTYKKKRIGIPRGQKGAAHAVRTINQNRRTVAAFR